MAPPAAAQAVVNAKLHKQEKVAKQGDHREDPSDPSVSLLADKVVERDN